MSGTDLREVFFQECEDLLEALQDGLRQMDTPDHDPETVHAVFRAVHSIKGGAGAFGLDALVDFAHRFETAMDRVRAGDLAADPEVMHVFHRAGDHLADLVVLARTGKQAGRAGDARLLAEIDALAGPPEESAEGLDFQPLALDLGPLPGLPASPEGAADTGPDTGPRTALGAASPLPDSLTDTPTDPPTDPPAPPGATRWRIAFAPTAALYTAGNDPALLFRALERLGPLRVEADATALPPLAALDPMAPCLHWRLELTTDAPAEEIAAVFEFVEGLCGLEITADSAETDAATDMAAGPGHGPEHGGGEAAPADPASPGNSTANNTAHNTAGSEDAARAPRSSAAAPAAAPAAASDAAPAPQPTIRVNLDRVDRLINLVGELVIKEAMLSQSIARLGLPPESGMTTGLDGLKQLAGEIQEGVMAIRAQPVKSMFQRMFRIVREAAEATGKQVRLEVQGDQTEVDKTVIERLVDPLTHMIRNAVDHGLEDPDTRLAAGKPAQGRVVLSAAHRSGRVMIEVSDDGGGVNRDKVRALAEARGLVAPGADLSASEIDNLLFLPGFSSKDTVSALSGRGVGLDVVKSEIHALGGRVTIASTPGAGTTFSVSLPLTLAVLEGMVVEVAGQTMVIPITAIQETLQPGTATVHPLGSGERVLISRGAPVPLIDLGATLGYRTAPAALDDHVLVVLQVDAGRRCAVVVDHIHDQRQVVIKSLERNYGRVEGVAAATILGDGRIALIIDPDEIVARGGGRLPGDLSLAAMG